MRFEDRLPHAWRFNARVYNPETGLAYASQADVAIPTVPEQVRLTGQHLVEQLLEAAGLDMSGPHGLRRR